MLGKKIDKKVLGNFVDGEVAGEHWAVEELYGKNGPVEVCGGDEGVQDESERQQALG